MQTGIVIKGQKRSNKQIASFDSQMYDKGKLKIKVSQSQK